MRFFFLSYVFIFFVTNAVAGDILTTTDNLVFEGKIKKIKDCVVTIKIEGSKYDIPSTNIHSIYFEKANDKILLDYLELTAADSDKCLKGSLDAEFLHGRHVGHFVLGFLFGPFAIVGAALANPSPIRGYETYAKSTNSEFFSDPEYLSCYRKKARRDNAKKAVLGFATSTLVIPIVIQIITGGVGIN